MDIQKNNNVGDMFYELLTGSIEETLLYDRDVKVFSLRYGLYDGAPHTLEYVGNIIGVTRERIRQIVNRCIHRIKNKAKKQAREGDFYGGSYKLVHFLKNTLQLTGNNEDDGFKIATFVIDVDEMPKYLFGAFIADLLNDKKNAKRKKTFINSFIKNILNELEKEEKAEASSNRLFEKFSLQIDWPPFVKIFNDTSYLDIVPTRPVRLDGVGDAVSYFSTKLQRDVEYESQIEYRFFKWVERTDKVIFYVEQPFEIPVMAHDVNTLYHPDLFIVFEDFTAAVVEIKPPAQMAVYQNVVRRNALKDFCNKNGYGFIYTDGYRTIQKYESLELEITLVEDLLNEIKERTLYWKTYKKYKDKHDIGWDTFIAFIVQYGVHYQFSPFQIQKGDYYKVVGSVSVKERVNKTDDKPRRHGSYWDSYEDELVWSRFKAGIDLKEIALLHERTVSAIKIRLECLGYAVDSIHSD